MKPLIALIFGVALAFGQTTPKLLFSMPVKTYAPVPWVGKYVVPNPKQNEVYVVNEASLSIFDTTTKPWKLKKVISLPESPFMGILVNPVSGMILAFNQPGDITTTTLSSIMEIDPQAETVKVVLANNDKVFPLNGPAAFSTDGKTLYLTESLIKEFPIPAVAVVAIDVSTWTVLQTWPIGELLPTGIVALPDGKVYIVTEADSETIYIGPLGQFFVLEGNGSVTTTDLKILAGNIMLVPNGTAYIAGMTANLATNPPTVADAPTLVVNPSTNQTEKTINVYGLPADFVASPASTSWQIYTGYSAGNLFSVNLATGYNSSSVNTGSKIFGLAAYRQTDGADIVLVLHDGSLDVYQAVPPAPPAPTSSTVTNAASGQPGISPGSLATNFGNFGVNGSTSSTNRFAPIKLENVELFVNNTPAALLFVSGNQVNFQVPPGTKVGPSTIETQVNGILVSTATETITATSPAAFESQGRGITTDESGTIVGTVALNSLNKNQPYTLWLTGLGATDGSCKTLAPGEPAPDATCVTVAQPTLKIGTTQAEVLWSGLSPGFVGLYQLNFELLAPPTTDFATLVPTLVTGTITSEGQSSTFPIVAKQ